MKQKQHRPKTRAKHGSPIYSERVAAWVTPEQRAFAEKHGISETTRMALAYYMTTIAQEVRRRMKG
jgi:hypothetical protein